MTLRIPIFLAVCLLSFPALAQLRSAPTLNEGKEGEITAKPICTYLVNRSDQTIIGTIATASQTIASGDTVRHRENFRLESGERKQICAAGPFYEGRRLELVLKTLLPLFDCKTKIDREIYLDATVQESGFKKLSATCY